MMDGCSSKTEAGAHPADELLPAETEAAWAAEIERRIADYERGKCQTYSAKHVFAEARRLTQ